MRWLLLAPAILTASATAFSASPASASSPVPGLPTPSPSPSPAPSQVITAEGKDVTVDEMDEVSLFFVNGLIPFPVPVDVGHGCTDTSPNGDFGYDVQATFTSSNSSATEADFSGTATYDDGTTAPLTIRRAFSPSGNAFDAGGDHAPYGEPGVHHSTLSIHGKDGSAATVMSTITVTDVKLGLSLCPPRRVAAGRHVSGLIAAVLDGYPRTGVGDYVVTINWGDGAISPAALALGGPNGNSILVSGDHVYATPGRRRVTVSAREIDDRSAAFAASASTTVTVVSSLPTTSAAPRGGADASPAIAILLPGLLVLLRRRRQLPSEP